VKLTIPSDKRGRGVLYDRLIQFLLINEGEAEKVFGPLPA
jgi:hypothetical protein